MSLIKVIDVKRENCVNCHSCISVCPVKFCNNAIEDYISVNENLCIGCGECLKACKHEARTYIDDFENFINDLTNKEKIICVIAPAVVSNFPNQYLNLNGWLKT